MIGRFAWFALALATLLIRLVDAVIGRLPIITPTTTTYNGTSSKEAREAPESSSNTGLIVGIVCAILGLFTLFGIAVAVYWFVIRKKAGKDAALKAKNPKKMPDTVELINKESKLGATLNGFKTVE
ncbi:hypothetical protein L596_017487 [Steinernema carpocapsae]|uniref:Syndecan/Neurexin domain-containing protein n=1 Tax=Steinernema carpocapsae TaxID=34508 RepID=A0A4U5N275_STECR|nr:hypothetical protein L596_017487 [Steinernema carpocapsae]